MYCPFCRHPDSRVIDSRVADDGTAIRRRRSCPECGRRFTTQESVILMVAKRSGVTEPFTRDKIVRGVQRACQGRPVDEDQLAMLAQRVEETIRARGLAEVPSHEVGLAILGPLRDLDEVAYLRFASVYRGFESLDDFEKAITELRDRRLADDAETARARTTGSSRARRLTARGSAGSDQPRSDASARHAAGRRQRGRHAGAGRAPIRTGQVHRTRKR